MLRYLFFTVLFFLIRFSVQAETVILRNHEVLHGKINYQDVNVLRMNDDSGKPIELLKNDILKVSYRDVKDAKEIKKMIEEEERKLPPEKRKKVGKIERKTKWSIVWRSTVLPGWGQWMAGKKGYAGLSFIAMLAAAGYVNSERSAALKAEDTYNNLTKPIGIATILSLATANSTNPFTNPFAFGQTGAGGIIGPAILGQILYTPYGKAVTKYNNSLQLIEIIFIIQLAHSYFIGKTWEKENPNTTINKKAAYGDWNINISPRQAYTPTGAVREPYYELNYIFQF